METTQQKTFDFIAAMFSSRCGFSGFNFRLISSEEAGQEVISFSATKCLLMLLN